MRAKAAVIVLGLYFIFSAINNPLKGQDVLKKHVTINISGQLMKDALNNISILSGVKFTFGEDVINDPKRVNVSGKDQEIKELLNKLIKNTHYTYKILGDEILVKFKTDFSASPQNAPHMVTGQVLDETGKPLVLVTVKNKSTGMATATDARGMYKIQVGAGRDMLIFTIIGYQTAESGPVGNKGNIDMQLKPELLSELKEVAIVAYGQQRKISLIGAQTTVPVADLTNKPVASMSALLTGRVSGIAGLQTSGEPGSDGASIWIRGIASLNSSAPLIMIDGVDRGNLDYLDPLDISSFTILKDASATAVYGVNGANGAILIQTKKGSVGKPRVESDVYQGYQTFTRIPDMADGITYMQAVNEANTTRGQSPVYPADYIDRTQRQTDPLLYPNVNWMKALFRNNALIRHAHVSLSGGSGNTTYYMATAYQYTGGLLKTNSDEGYNINDDFARFNFTLNVNSKLAKNTKLDVGLKGFAIKGNSPAISSSDIFQQAMILPPVTFPVMYPGGYVPGRNPNGDQRNPYADLTTRGFLTGSSGQLYSDVRLTQGLDFLTQGLNFSVMAAFDDSRTSFTVSSKRKSTYLLNPSNPYNSDGSLNLEQTYDAGSDSILNRQTQTYGGHKIYTEAALNYRYSYGQNQVSGLLLFNQDSRSSYPASDLTASIPFRHRGLAVRGTYSYRERYFAEFNAGYNGSENFAPQNRYGFFPAFGVGWLLSSEKFFKPLSTAISLFKIRYSDGYVGSSDEGTRFAYLTILGNNYPGYIYGQDRVTVPGIDITQYGIDVTWSRSHKQDLGIDLKFFDDKVSVTADIFREHRTGILITRADVPGFLGFSSLAEGNIGIVDNEGLDLSFEHKFQLGKMRLNVSATLTYSQNKVIQNGQPAAPYSWMDQRGAPVSAQFGYIADGLFTSQTEINTSAVPGDRSQIRPGDIRYQDLNRDGVINAYDETKIGNGTLPQLFYGAIIHVGYKNMDVSAAFTGTGRADRYISGSAIQPFSSNQGISNAFANITDRWTVTNPGQRFFYPRLAYGDAANFNNTLESTWWIKNMAFFRLKTIDLGYRFPPSLVSKFHLGAARVYCAGYNLFTLSSFKLWDPELNTGNGTMYPNVKTIALGVSVQIN